MQKTNIIRDYLEDINELPAPRMFWPREIWGQYGESLDSFKEPENSKAAVKCLNHLVMDALRLVIGLSYVLTRVLCRVQLKPQSTPSMT